jgi:3-hydroxybutyryl-CoA dehydrogenase
MPFEQILATLGWNYQIVPDVPGMIAASVIAMIINEAYFAWGDEVSTKQDIDTAMKLGTNYPHGPFEWCDIIGVQPIYHLLQELAKADDRYTPAPALTAEALSKTNTP